MIGSGIPISQRSAPLPKLIVDSPDNVVVVTTRERRPGSRHETSRTVARSCQHKRC